MSETITSVLFVCLGNICRSPSAEAVFRHKVKQFGLHVKVDSAGTHGYHKGASPDERSVEIGEARGYSFDGISCRKVGEQDFAEFDLILAMDESNVKNLLAKCPEEYQYKVELFMSYSDEEESEVPDPYYGGRKGFEYVLTLIESASDGLIHHIQTSK